MEKKYYDIIVAIVKQNDKYAGCEPILDDIVQDVYDHSKVVLGSVSNEDVINAYLNKVVATSLITVPKKLNFNTRNKHRIISNVEAITNVSLPANPVEPQIEEVQLESFDEPANTMEELTFEEEEQTAEIIEEPEFEFDSIEDTKDEFIIEEPIEETTTVTEDFESIVEEVEDNTTFDLEEENSLEDFSAALSEEPEFVIETPEQDVDKTLVDKMINGVELEPAEPEELSVMEEPAVLEEDESDNSFEIEEVSLQEEPEIIEESSIEEFSFAEEPVLLQEEEEVIEEENEILIAEDTTEHETSMCKLPDFECFSYEPETPEFDEEEICADLKELDSKHPEKKLLQICKLKYEENQSVAEIAQTLDFSEEAVLDTLNDIIELVKE
ncbi:MAG: hypothetical protein NC408_06150 [Candidatus Gastranaerophilales bacterium]|nr:hypothetical protein [Candidatus Gastranaerophilales bacterium]MCM1072831.1 hypothetical protein [Bacteroides sp.]